MKFLNIKLLLTSMCYLFLFHNDGMSQKTITGTVNDKANVPMIGATVLVKNTDSGTITDVDGSFSISVSDSDVLVVSFLGYATQEISIGNRNVIDITLLTSGGLLDEIIVSSTRKPIRKLQSTAAVNNVGLEEITRKQPESFTEAIENSPGVNVRNGQGRKAEFNIRGFPGGNTYTTTLIDGVPSFGISSLSGGTAEIFGLDPNTERIEVVRGSAATLFGRAAAAGAVNVISKVGGNDHKGSVSFTRYNNVSDSLHKFAGDFDYRADINFNGPLSDKLRYNIGGYYINDSGIKESHNKDKGAQVRANLDYLISDKSSIRIYGAYLNNQFQNITDMPWNMGESRYHEGWGSHNTYYNDASDLDFTATGSVDANGNVIEFNPSEFKESVNGANVGIEANLHLGNGLYLNQKNRVSAYDWSDINEITFASMYTTETPVITRGNFGGYMNMNDFINETRIQKQIEGEKISHNLNAGVYFSTGNRNRYVPAVLYLSTVSTRPDFIGFGPPGTPIGTNFFDIPGRSQVRIEETAVGFFAGDEMVINEKLSLMLGLRYDLVTGFASNDTEEVGGFDYVPPELSETELDFKDWSGSLGVNYLLTDRSAIYGNVLRAFSLPTVGNGTELPEKNEIITNFEIGYRAGAGDLTFDVALFNTSIDNRLTTEFDTDLNQFVQKAVGKNIVRGGELALTYAPDAVKGLLLRGSFTLQNSQFQEFLVPLGNIDTDGDMIPDTPEADLDNLFGLKLVGSGTNSAIDVSGNQVNNTPSSILNVNASFSQKYYSINFGGFTYGGMYATALNLYELPSLSVFNAGITGKYPLGDNQAISLGVRVKNLFNGSNLEQLVIGSTQDNVLVQKQLTPEFDNVLGFAIAQAPRRVLITLGYTF